MAEAEIDWLDVAWLAPPRPRYGTLEAGATLCWMGFIFGPTFMLQSERWHRLAGLRQGSVGPSFWSLSLSGRHWVPIRLACLAAPVIVD